MISLRGDPDDDDDDDDDYDEDDEMINDSGVGFWAAI